MDYNREVSVLIPKGAQESVQSLRQRFTTLRCFSVSLQFSCSQSLKLTIKTRFSPDDFE